MAKLSLVNAKDMAKIAEKLGFVKVRQNGSHARYKADNGLVTVIPMHIGDLKRALIRDIISQMGITPDEYEMMRKSI